MATAAPKAAAPSTPLIMRKHFLITSLLHTPCVFNDVASRDHLPLVLVLQVMRLAALTPFGRLATGGYRPTWITLRSFASALWVASRGAGRRRPRITSPLNTYGCGMLPSIGKVAESSFLEFTLLTVAEGSRVLVCARRLRRAAT